MKQELRTRILTGAALAVPVAVAIGLSTQTSSPMADARAVAVRASAVASATAHRYLLDCSHRPAVRPTSIDIACGGDDAALTHVRWASWSARAASGAGTFVIDTCTPDCATGTTADYPVRVRAVDPVGRSGGKRYRTLQLVFPDAQPHGVHGHRSVIDLDGLRGL